MTNKEFWKSIPFDEVLICQHDSGLLKTGIDDFLGYDWVGAPWIFQNHGGNGGLSLRRKQSMLDICSNTHYSTNLGNEDLFYCNIMYYSKNFKLAPREVCERFSVEGIFKLGTLGYHFGVDSNRLLTTDQKKQILRQYEQKGRVRANI